MNQPTMRALFLACLGAVVAAGADTSSRPPSPVSVPPNAAASTNLPAGLWAHGAAAQRLLISGAVVAVDTTNHWLELRGTNGIQRVSFGANPLVLLAGQRLALSNVVVGDRGGIVARAQTNGHWELISLRLAPRPPGDGNAKKIDRSLPDR